MRMHRAAPALGAAHAPAATERRNIPHAQLGVLRRSRRPPRSTEARLPAALRSRPPLGAKAAAAGLHPGCEDWE
ncbi:hypothetical protein CapIbe_005397 [Capra ibex]